MTIGQPHAMGIVHQELDVNNKFYIHGWLGTFIWWYHGLVPIPEERGRLTCALRVSWTFIRGSVGGRGWSVDCDHMYGEPFNCDGGQTQGPVMVHMHPITCKKVSIFEL